MPIRTISSFLTGFLVALAPALNASTSSSVTHLTLELSGMIFSTFCISLIGDDLVRRLQGLFSDARQGELSALYLFCRECKANFQRKLDIASIVHTMDAMSKIIRWDSKKSAWLKANSERGGIGFEECVILIEAGQILDSIDNPRSC